MKTPLRVFVLLSLSVGVCATRAFAGSGTEYGKSSTQAAAASDAETVVPFEFDLEYAYIGSSDVERSFRKADFDENYGLARFIYRPRTAVGYLRLGAAYEHYEFGMPSLGLVAGNPAGVLIVGRPQLPDTLHSVSAVIGLDTKFSDSLLFRIEAQPGFYGGDNLNADSFNIPVIVGGTYIINPDLQIIFGVSVDYERNYPVFPGGGIRWRFAPQWVLNAAAPTPRLEYEATKNLTLYAGGDLKGSTYRMDDNFGVGRGDLRLNHAVLTYSEIRTGGGVEWKMTSDVRLSVEAGYLPYREFDYHRADIRYKYDTGAPYGAVALHASF
jgi:hypothetical protein